MLGGAEKEKARSNFVMLLSSRKSLPFRGRLVSLRVLKHYGVSPMPFLPQECRNFRLDINVKIRMYDYDYLRMYTFAFFLVKMIFQSIGITNYVYNCCVMKNAI